MGVTLDSGFLHTAVSFLFGPGVESDVQVTVRLTGPYKTAAGGVDQVSLRVTSPTLAGVLDAVTERFPEAGRMLRPSAGEIQAAVRVVLNDVVLQTVSLAHSIRDGDHVSFVPIVGGGTGGVSQSDRIRFWETFKNVLLLR